jgi:septum formation protein
VQLILASASPARLSTLRAAGVDPVVRVSTVDERAVLERLGITDPADVPLVLARAKAEDVAGALEDDGSSLTGPGPLVLGCDSILDLDGMALGKPADGADAVLRWKRMRGRTGRLRTGHWVIDRASGRALGDASVTVVHFADLSDAEIEAYVATGEPLHVAGAFTVDGLGGPFVTGIEGDHHGVVGVSLPLLRTLLNELGVAWTSLWGQASRRD